MVTAIEKWKVIIFVWCAHVAMAETAVMPPPWANPKINPCATQPRGWQLLYWPPDGKCYKIFQIGYPCPDGMELSPGPTGKEEYVAECRCPPRSAQSARDGKCYELFTAGPCEKGQYFAPDPNSPSNSKRRWGTCKDVGRCPRNEIFWSQNEQCYMRLTRGPCPKGQLITLGPNKLAICKCNFRYEMQDYWSSNGKGCFEHFTRGPCKEHGHLFLPDRSCGCRDFLPHYYDDTQQCFEIGTIGPCNAGEQFRLDSDQEKATCHCKNGHIKYEDSSCYRPYTQGPCDLGYILVNATTCVKQPCERGQLYHPETERCYRIGTKGPCSNAQVITFDFETRPSVDGISYNGVCRCEKTNENKCVSYEQVNCEHDRNLILYKNQCYKLYSQGPCQRGAWLTPKRQKKEIWTDDERKEGVCECMPGYKEVIRTLSNSNVTECVSPTVILADYLNKNFYL